MRRLLLAAALAGFIGPLVAATEAPGAIQSLNRFFNEVKSYTAAFHQDLLDETGKPVQESTGRLWIERPNKFRWNYDKPYKQQIVGDGGKIWIHDEELQQVTVREMGQALLDTPAVLLAGKGRLEDQFTIKNLGTQGKLEWVQLVPRKKESGFEEFRIGFEKGKIRQLDLVDGLGQTTRYTLRDGMENVKISPARFVFEPPPGVDVVGEP
ncbi:membrane protein [Sulfurifustis variabilis]|uniref:Outer-membrane lipoprotein carrier protein n=1 Tax=Sulfurifustis variabilis TaxID=1675686 RepID=A0A1B4VBZ6_9GAMM|nr:outer membrane lipoprotein chaperone LolA [Sulfurifustis variabilis]BAU48551.1 membrane protein [Sulfurifustis variabilis]